MPCARVRARGKLAEILSFSRFGARRSGTFGALKRYFRCDLTQLSCQAAVPFRPSEGFWPFNSAFRHELREPSLDPCGGAQPQSRHPDTGRSRGDFILAGRSQHQPITRSVVNYSWPWQASQSRPGLCRRHELRGGHRPRCRCRLSRQAGQTQNPHC